MYAEATAGVALLGAIGLGALATLMAVLWWRSRTEAAALRARFGPVVDLEAERIRVEAQRDALRAESSALAAAITASREALRAEIAKERDAVSAEATRQREAVAAEIATKRQQFEAKYSQALSDLDRLTHEVKVYDEKANLQSFGLYTPYYDFGTSEQYKAKLESVRDRQGTLLKAGRAAVCSTEWTVDGDKRKGKQMTDRNLKLMLRAFNGECDAAIAKVRFNNAVAIEERIRKAFDALNKLGEPNKCSITEEYRDLKLDELHLTHEYAEKLQAEKEEQREIRERLRDEEQAQRDFERAQREAEKEEQRFALALAKARSEVSSTVGAKHAEAEARVLELERRLAEAQAQKERAISQAQLTKSGHVYIISNEGSFGESVFKVGMTRRLDPMERVKELGDASVPFSFDVHAIIYSEDAPALESALHRALAKNRVNLVNLKKEFFSTTLDEIEAAVRQHAQGDYSFVRLAVAEEYRKSAALRESTNAPSVEPDAPLLVAERARFDEVRHALADI